MATETASTGGDIPATTENFAALKTMALSKKPTPLEAIQLLTSVGKALSAEKDHDRLMELILHTAKDLTLADGGTLYSRTDDDRLEFEIMLNDSLGLCQGGTSGRPVAYAPLPLYDEDGRPNERMVSPRAVITGATVNIPDAYVDARFNQDVDRQTGYRTQSVLCMPVVNKEGRKLAVIQVLNKRGGPFRSVDERRLRAFTAQIAIALENARLFDDILNERNYNESILSSLSNGVISLDTGLQVAKANEAVLRILGMRADDAIGVSEGGAVAPGRPAGARRRPGAGRRPGRPSRRTFRLRIAAT